MKCKAKSLSGSVHILVGFFRSEPGAPQDLIPVPFAELGREASQRRLETLGWEVVQWFISEP